MRRKIRKRLNRDPAVKILAPMTSNELKEAYLACIRLSQAKYFKTEIECLKKRDKRLPARHLLTSLKPIVDKSDGILYVGGRLEQATLSFNQRHPPILDSDCCLTRLVAWWSYERALHGGIRVTYSYLNQQAWVIGG